MRPAPFPARCAPRYGKFEHGRGGTILLDEIGSMPFDLQAKFLRVLQERVITRLGSNEAVPLDVRFIATSKVDLEAEVAAGRFRADLLYRLNVATLHVPSLAQRREDIPLLFLQLVREAAARYGRDDVEVPPDVSPRSPAATGPAMCANCAMPPTASCSASICGREETPAPTDSAERLADQVADFERRLIASALAAHGGSRSPSTKRSAFRARRSTRRCRNTGSTRGSTD